jgi:hypothetical protein
MSKRQVLKTEQKALEINLNPKIYGTFAEIGAGQEVARNFFQVGAAAGTIAKTMSAYDKTYSDAIYGEDDSRRYVCESRIYKMLDHEYKLIEKRLSGRRSEHNFFVFADTISAINYQRTIKGNGWLGLRFQHFPGASFSDVVMHAKMLDKNNRQQQEAIGVLGVNLIYACFYYRHDPEHFVQSLLDGLKSRISVDMIRVKGPAFQQYDNRLLSLYLVKHQLSEVTMINQQGNSIHPSEFLYKKDLMVVRGHFRPPTLVTQDAFTTSFKQFRNESKGRKDQCVLMAELTLDNLRRFAELSTQDFLDRVDMLCTLGYPVIISDCQNHQRLINYLADYKIGRLGIVLGVHELLEIMNDKFHNNRDGRLLVSFGELFSRNIRVYAYPALEKEGDKLIFVDNLPVPDGIKFLYQHLIENRQIVEVEGYNKNLLHIIPGNIFKAIGKEGETWWEDCLPSELVYKIKEKRAFGYSSTEENTQESKKVSNDAEYY